MCAAQTIPPTLCQVAEAPLEQPPREVRVQVGEESPLMTLLRFGANVPGLQAKLNR